nr:ISAs1 family transposase [Streptomyces sp. NBC_00830]WTB28595.1 ISAs1 family transposase [Streptomyces sp. NBC_00830]WTB35774.1 ISAs1 family transposase [Streptomyces sp. NBC_00830]
MFVPPSSPIVASCPPAPRLQDLVSGRARGQVHSLIDEFDTITDPRGACGVRYQLSSLLALMVCAMTPAGHDSITAAAEWCRRAAPEELAAFRLPYHPLLGRYRVPSEKTLRTVLGRLNPAELSAAGHTYLLPLLAEQSVIPSRLMPDGTAEREQRRAHTTATRTDPPRRRRRAIAVDGKCLRGARRPDGSQVFVLSAVTHGDGITLASREIGAKTNEIPEFQPLLNQIDDADLRGTVVTVDALHAQRDHAAYLHERGAHYLLTIKNNQKNLARQLHRLPWKDVPVIHRDDSRGHGRDEQRHVQVVTVDGLLFPHAAQVLRICRRRRLYGAKKWSTETVYAITDLPAEQASAAEIASWARGHWTVENTVHWCRDVVFGEDKSQVRARNAPAVLAAIRDLIRGALHLTDHVNIAAGRRAHTERHRVLALYGIT